MMKKLTPDPKTRIQTIQWGSTKITPKKQVVNNIQKVVRTHSSSRNICANLAFISQIEPKSFKETKRQTFNRSKARSFNNLKENKVLGIGPSIVKSFRHRDEKVFIDKLDWMGKLWETKLNLWPKDTLNKKELILKKL